MDKTIPEATPLVSVIMCSYNARPFIEQAVNCILNQTFGDLELIISDDCSTDGTQEWLKTIVDPRVRLYLQEKNLGYVANKNFAHRLARGQYLTQLDSDDTCSLDKLEKQLAVVRKHPEIKLVGCGYHKIDDQDNIYYTVSEPQDRLILQVEEPYPFWFPALLVHAEVFEQIGYFDPFFSGLFGDDFYWTIRANEKWPIYYLHDPLYGYRNNPNSITNMFNNERKLIIARVLEELIRQRRQTKTDWLEQKDAGAVKAFEQSLLRDKSFMAEQYRVWAAKAVDKKDWAQFSKLIQAALSRDPFKISVYRTLLYFLRRFFQKTDATTTSQA